MDAQQVIERAYWQWMYDLDEFAQNLFGKNFPDLLKDADWYTMQTGGGCTAWVADLPNDHMIILTDLDGCQPPKSREDGYLLGFGDQDTLQLECWGSDNVRYGPA